MSLRKCLLLVSVLVLGLLTFSCDKEDDWVEIYVNNNYESGIIVLVEKRMGESGSYYPSKEKEIYIISGESMRYEGSSGYYRITVTSGDDKYHHPKGGNFSESSWSNIKLFTFNGELVSN